VLDFLKPIPVGFKGTEGDTIGPGLQNLSHVQQLQRRSGKGLGKS